MLSYDYEGKHIIISFTQTSIIFGDIREMEQYLFNTVDCIFKNKIFN